MAKLVLLNSNVILNGTDITNNVAAVTLSTSAAEVPTTSFGSGGAVTRVSGLIDNSVTLSLHNDYNAIDGLITPLIGSTAVTMIVKPAGTATAGSFFFYLDTVGTPNIYLYVSQITTDIAMLLMVIFLLSMTTN